MRTWKHIVSSAVAAVLVIGGLGATADAAEDPPTAAHLDWLIRPSFDSYVGGGTPSDGATRTDAGKYRFTYESGGFDSATLVTDVQYSGTVHYEKYAGSYPSHPDVPMLDVTISDPRVVLSKDGSALYADVQSREMSSDPAQPPKDYGVIPLANLDVAVGAVDASADETSWSTIGATLAEPGVAAFAGFYQTGAALDSLTFTHPGAGGFPTAAERFDTPGAPRLVESGRWNTSPGVSQSGSESFVSGDGSTLFMATRNQLGVTTGQIYPLDAVTLAPLTAGPYQAGFLPDPKLHAFDPATNTFYLGEPTFSGRSGAGRVLALAWDAEEKTFTETVLLDGLKNPVGLAWDAQRQRIVVATAPTVSTDVADVLVIAKTADGWSTTSSAIANTAVTSSRYGTKTAKLTFDTTIGSTYQVLDDGSVLVPGNNQLKVTAVPLGTGTISPVTAPTVIAIDSTGHATATAADELVQPGDRDHATFDAQGRPTWKKDATTSRTYVSSTGAVVGFSFDFSLAAREQLFLPYSMRTVSRRDGELVLGDPVEQPEDVVFDTGVGDPVHGADYLLNGQGAKISVLKNGQFVGELAVPDSARQAGGFNGMAMVPDGSAFFVPIRDGVSRMYGVARIAVTGVAPTITTQPKDQQIDVQDAGDTERVTLSAGADSGDLQWQSRRPGQSGFSDVAGATASDYTFDAKAADHGVQFRVVASNEAGRVVSDVAALTVDSGPSVATQPASGTFLEGQDAVFTVVASGNPEPAVTWQRQVGGFWQTVDGDDPSVVVDGPSLTIKDTTVDQSGARFRARLTNSVATVYSRTATLTVKPKVTVPAEGLTLDGVVLDWTGSDELQSAPPFGGSNFFSAGVSDGSQATYRAADADVTILHVAAGDQESPTTWATRNAQVTGDVTQLVRLSDGEARLAADGSATITWDGSWSVNFYGGLVPFTVTDPVLDVAADGTGTLTADLDGYASTQADPNVRSPLDTVEDVTIATFSDVRIDPTGTIDITPDYAGVTIDAPAGQTAQDRSAPGWGAWPAEFVDFHFATGLSSYWYSSGLTADPRKTPNSFAVDFTDAEESGAEPEPPVDLASTTTVRPARASVPYGSTTTATVTVSAPGTTPAGVVTVDVADRRLTGTLRGGVAVVTLPSGLKPGSWPLLVAYPGGPGVGASTGSARVTVTKAKPTISAKLMRSAIKRSQRGALRVTVVLPGSPGVRPTGQLVIRDGNRIVRTRTLRHGHHGKVTITLPRLSRGRHFLRTTIMAGPVQSARSTTYTTLTVR